MPLIARQRSRLAVLAVLALVGSLLAVSAVPAVAAKDEKPSAKAMYSACVGAATDDAGFTDTAGNFAEDEINCLAHYMIALGTSDGVFSPNDSISRAQMALFMQRAAGVAGIELDDPEDQGLGDIGNWTDTIQDAINQVVDAGIMSGDNDDMFNPTGAVSRADMAVILDAFLMAAEVDLDDDYDVADADIDEPFSDIDGVPVSAFHAINRLYEFGVAEGKGDGSFDPGALVSRAQMAAFVTRALAHTNARPAGISAQGPAEAHTTDTINVMVSVRDMDHQPVPDALVAAITSENPDEAFDDQGACVGDETSGDCSISTSNEATDPDGNATLEVDPPTSAATLTVWVWTGESGDKFDADTTKSAMLEIDVSLPPTKTLVTDDVKDNADFLKFGDTVTYTFQVANDEDEPVAKADAEVRVKATIEDVTPLETGDDGTGQLRDDIETTVTTHKTDAAGRFEVSFTAPDPNAGDSNRGDRVRLLLTLDMATHALSSKANDQGTDTPGAGIETIQIDWSDAASVATTLTLSQTVAYHEVDSDGDGVGNALMATLVDQYGDPIRDEKVTVWSDATNTDGEPKAGLGGSTSGSPGSATAPADHRTTNKSGVATKRYTRAGTTAATELLDGNYIKVNGMCRDILDDCTESDDETAVDTDAITHYWAVRVNENSAEAARNALGTASAVLVADKDNNSIVITTGVSLVTYKSGDYFQIAGDSATMEAFEKALNDGRAAGSTADEVIVTFNATSGINTFNISTNN